MFRSHLVTFKYGILYGCFFFFFSSKTAITLLKQCLMKIQKFLARKGFMFFLSPKVISFSFMQWKKKNNVLLNKRRIRKIKMHTTGHVEKGSIYTFAQLCLEDHSWNYSRLSFWVVGKRCGVQVPCTKFFKIVAVKKDIANGTLPSEWSDSYFIYLFIVITARCCLRKLKQEVRNWQLNN